ncbi:MAG: S46 family peptidase [Caulobacteraceae bacterium]
MLTRLVWILACLVTVLATPAAAEEGMWTFDDAPTAQVRQALGVRLDRAWLDHLQGAAVRLTSGCSGAVVSPRGLVLTNQHCLVGCEQSLSAGAADYVADGFATQGRAEEVECPGLSAEVLEGITDVTAAIWAASARKFGEDYVASREGALAAAEKSVCKGDPRLRCQVIGFYGGGEFKVYAYRRYDDVRLVFAPEYDVAFFGGDPDNFAFPRFALDCAFLRLYVSGSPARTADFLSWSAAAPKPAEAVFVAGNPGSSERSLTQAQLVSLRDVALPIADLENAELRGRLTQFSAQSEENRRAAAPALFDLDNTAKLLRGQRLALGAADFLAARARAEAALKARLAVDARLAAQVGDPWAKIAAVQQVYRDQYLVWRELEADAGAESTLFGWARILVRGAEERAKPPAARLPEFADQRLPLVEKTVLDGRVVYPPLERLELEFWLAKVRETLGPDALATEAILGKESPESLARRLAASRLADPAFRRALWEGGAAAVGASSDPLVAFVRRTDPVSRAARRLWEEEVVGPAQEADERIERVRLAAQGPDLYPEATFSLRLSYGKVAAGDSPAEAGRALTRLAGLFRRASGVAPFRLTPRWIAARSSLDPATVLDFTTTNDIVGGNSGSPVVDAKGEIIGAAFDGNAASIAGDFAYDGASNRTIAVSTAAIGEALAKVYGRADLMRELNPTPRR